MFVVENLLVGNAAFHSNQLYPILAQSILPLGVAMESETDEKTRANAAGAIGNLVRNGGELAREMVLMGVPERLMKMALVDADLSPQVRTSYSCFFCVSTVLFI